MVSGSGNGSRTFTGVAASPGYAHGRLVVHRAPTLEDIPRYQLGNGQAEDEVARFQNALGLAVEELEWVKEQVLAEIGQAEAGIFDAHLALLQDEAFAARIHKLVNEEMVNVEQALAVEIDAFTKLMESMANEYMRERALDLRDVGNRLIRHLSQSGRTNPLAQLEPDSIVVASELMPSDTVALDRSKVVGLVTALGGVNSHCAILARSMGIPAVTGITGVLDEVRAGQEALIDGVKGVLTVAPGEQQERRFRRRQRDYDHALSLVLAEAGEECRLSDGTRVTLLGNVNGLGDIAAVETHNLDGVGLFRTEMLYMADERAPTLAIQHRDYRRAARALGDRQLTIRTLDLGDDKVPAFMPAHRKESGSLSTIRGLRFCLQEGRLFRRQLRAILRTWKEHPNVRLLFPMVTGRRGLVEAMDMVRDAAKKEGVKELPPIGAMVETPAAVFALDDLVDMVDFISVGSNDLVQYMLAVDRDTIELLSYDPCLHPAVLRALRTIAKTCRRAKCSLSVCGEAAGDPALAGIFVGLGYRCLSMSAVRAPRVRYALRHLSLAQAEDLAAEALTANSETEVLKTVKKHFPVAIRALEG